MKRYARTIVMLVSLLALHAGSTVTAETLLRVNIPFGFTAGTTTLPAGTYFVGRPEGSLGVLEVHGAKHHVFLSSHDGMLGATVDNARLVFNRYGDRYFLREVWVSGKSGYPIHESAEEREWVRAQGPDAAPRRVRLIILSVGERK